MGAKTWMLVYSEASVGETLASKPPLDRKRSVDVARCLFSDSIHPEEDVDLSWTCPEDSHLHIGCYADVSIVAAQEFGIDRPSELDPRFLRDELGPRAQLHAMHSVVDWFAFGVWERGTLRRSLSVSPDCGFLENIGDPLEFERPYWSGEHPAVEPDDDDPEDPYPLPFDPLELGNEALGAMFGYILEGSPSQARFDAEELSLLRFRRTRRKWWRIW